MKSLAHHSHSLGHNCALLWVRFTVLTPSPHLILTQTGPGARQDTTLMAVISFTLNITKGRPHHIKLCHQIQTSVIHIGMKEGTAWKMRLPMNGVKVLNLLEATSPALTLGRSGMIQCLVKSTFFSAASHSVKFHKLVKSCTDTTPAQLWFPNKNYYWEIRFSLARQIT